MRYAPSLALLSATLVVAACQDTSQPLVPPEPSAALVQPGVTMAQEAERVMAGRVLARLADGADPATVGQAHGLSVAREHSGFVAFSGPVGNERALAARLRGDDRVVWAEPDYLRQTTEIDERLWAFHNPGGLSVLFTRGRNKGDPVTSYYSVADADEDAMEGIGIGGASVAIASIDTGVDIGHLEFSGGGSASVVYGYDYYDDDSTPSDSDGHGTHTTGTMVGRTVGVAGVTGAAENVTVHVYRVCGPLGCPTSAIVSAIRAAADAGVVAMNLSLGGGSLSQAEADAIDYALFKNALVIASAGNGSTSTVSCPACDEDAISVAATDWLDEQAYYTSYGDGLDMSAPGGELYSNTTSEAGIYSSVPGGYAYYQGTSMAAPQVTGAAAVVASMNPSMIGDASALRSRLLGTTDDLGPSGEDAQFGHGRLNVAAAVAGGGGDPPTDPPTDPPETLTASFTHSCSWATCSFDASGSTGAATYYTWDFGDGGTGSDVTASHTYGAEDTYTVTLTVGDGTGSEDTTSQTLSCSVRGKNLRCS